MHKIFFIVLILFFISGFIANAKVEQSFVDYLSRKIYETCTGSNINAGNSDTKINIPWPYSYSSVAELVTYIANGEFNWKSTPCKWGSVSFGKNGDGCGILTCGAHKLDINGTDYYLDDARIQGSQETYLANNNSGNMVVGSPGSVNTQTQNTGDIQNSIGQQIIADIIVGIIVASILGLFGYALFRLTGYNPFK